MIRAPRSRTRHSRRSRSGWRCAPGANEVADLAIRGLRAPGAQHAAGALADALAWKRFVAEAPDWPIDLPTLQRFVVPLALPLASLLGGAFLEAMFGRLVAG